MQLTADPAHLVERALSAAQANVQAGAFDKALGLLGMTEAWPLDEFASARVDLLRGQVAFASGLGSDAPPLLLKAARRLEPLDPDSCALISGLVRPLRASLAICASCAVSSFTVSIVRLRTVSPVATSSVRARSANPAMPIASSIW